MPKNKSLALNRRKSRQPLLNVRQKNKNKIFDKKKQEFFYLCSIWYM